jgi:hypothetical protein
MLPLVGKIGTDIGGWRQLQGRERAAGSWYTGILEEHNEYIVIWYKPNINGRHCMNQHT